MKICIALCLLAVAVKPHHLKSGPKTFDQDCGGQILEQAGYYPEETYTVETQDGYRLEVHRILGKVSEKHKYDELLRKGEPVRTGKPAVLLMHGILSDMGEYFLNLQNGFENLLVERGYEVYVGNFRGNCKNRQHHYVSSFSDPTFWDFSFHEKGTQDLASLIDSTLEKSGQSKIYYVAYNQAIAALFALLDNKPEYNDHIEKIIALGPMVFMKHTTNPVMRMIADNYKSNYWVSKHLGDHKFQPSSEFQTHIRDRCMVKGGSEKYCSNMYFLINAFGKDYKTRDTERVYHRLPASASTQEFLHYAQLIKSGKFEPYQGNTHNNEGQAEYNLKNIKSPVIIVSVPNDMLTNKNDVETLVERLPNVEEHIIMTKYASNLDLFLSEDVRSALYEPLVKRMITVV